MQVGKSIREFPPGVTLQPVNIFSTYMTQDPLHFFRDFGQIGSFQGETGLRNVKINRILKK